MSQHWVPKKCMDSYDSYLKLYCMYLYATSYISYLVSTCFNPEKYHTIIPGYLLELGSSIARALAPHNSHLVGSSMVQWVSITFTYDGFDWWFRCDFYARFINGFWEHLPENYIFRHEFIGLMGKSTGQLHISPSLDWFNEKICRKTTVSPSMDWFKGKSKLDISPSLDWFKGKSKLHISPSIHWFKGKSKLHISPSIHWFKGKSKLHISPSIHGFKGKSKLHISLSMDWFKGQSKLHISPSLDWFKGKSKLHISPSLDWFNEKI